MTKPAHPGRMLFVNMPVADLERSKAFFGELGFDFDPTFTDETAACMQVGQQAFVMLLSREKFAEFARLPMADPATHTLALYCFSVSSRDEVDAVSALALAAGGSEADDAQDYGFMYSRSFFDLDGHGWQVMWMDPAVAGAEPRGVCGLVTSPLRAAARPREPQPLYGRLAGLVNCLSRRPARESSMSCWSRRSRVSGLLALAIQCRQARW
jgi:uncharacterized protein